MKETNIKFDTRIHVTKLDVKNLNKDEFVKQRSRGAQIASIACSDSSFEFSRAAHSIKTTETDARALSKTITKSSDYPERGIKLVKLDPENLHISVFIESSFAENMDYTSQLGCIIVLMYDFGIANIIQRDFTKSKRVTRSALVAEIYAMVLEFDKVYVMKQFWDTIFV